MKFPKWMMSLKWQFLILLGLGGCVFLVALWIYPVVCSSSQKPEWNKNSEVYASKNEQPTRVKNEVIFSSAPEKETQSNHEDQKSAETYSRGETESLFCGIKITDLFLAFFTYCLVIVGWFQIRNTEQTIRDLERAFIFCGPGYYYLAANSASLNAATIANFSAMAWDRFEIIAANYGRSSAVVKEVCYVLSESEPQGDKPNYPNGISTRHEMGVNPTVGSPINATLVEITKPAIYTGEFFIYGFVIYEDIFHRRHTCRFSNKLIPHDLHLVPAGHPAWNQDD